MTGIVALLCRCGFDPEYDRTLVRKTVDGFVFVSSNKSQRSNNTGLPGLTRRLKLNTPFGLYRHRKTSPLPAARSRFDWMVPPTTPDHYTVGTQTVLEMTETRPAGATRRLVCTGRSLVAL